MTLALGLPVTSLRTTLRTEDTMTGLKGNCNERYVSLVRLYPRLRGVMSGID